jgi:hypothetical protein
MPTGHNRFKGSSFISQMRIFLKLQKDTKNKKERKKHDILLGHNRHLRI